MKHKLYITPKTSFLGIEPGQCAGLAFFMRVNIYIDGFNLYYGLYTHNPDAVSWATPNTVYPSKEIAPHVDFHRKIHFKHLKRNQLPETIPGTKIVKPGEW